MADRFVTRLGGELGSWVREGIITEEQRARIAARYRESGAPSRFVAILSLIGGALVTAGLALVIAHNWERLSDWTKIGGAVALMVGFYAGGLELRERGYGRTAEALLMVGGALFLCGIALVGQIYHLNARPPNAMLLWIAALFPIAYLLRSSPVLFLGLCGFLIWIGMEAHWNDSLIYLGHGDDARWLPDESILIGMDCLAVCVGVGLTAGGALHRGSFAAFRRPFEMFGILMIGVAIYLLGFLRHMEELTGRSIPRIGPILGFALAAIALAVAAWRRLPAEPRRTRATHVGLMAVCLAMAVAPSTLGLLGLAGSDTTINLSLFSWILLLGFSLHLISSGVRWERPGWINLGILLVGLNIITRYFDFLGSRLDQGLLYIMGGVLILVISLMLERQRRSLLRRMAQEGAP